MNKFLEKKTENNVIIRNDLLKEKYMTDLMIRNFMRNESECTNDTCTFTKTNIKTIIDRDTKTKYEEYNKVYTYDLPLSNLKFTIEHTILIKHEDKNILEDKNDIGWLRDVQIRRSTLFISLFVFDKYVPLCYNTMSISNKLTLPVVKYTSTLFNSFGLIKKDYEILNKKCNKKIDEHISIWLDSDKCIKMERLRNLCRNVQKIDSDKCIKMERLRNLCRNVQKI